MQRICKYIKIIQFILYAFIIFFNGCLLISCAQQHNIVNQDLPYNIKAVEINPHIIALQKNLLRKQQTMQNKALINLIHRQKYIYKIKPGDDLDIVVWGHPELNSPNNISSYQQGARFKVDIKGYIYYPYIGKIKIAGLDIIRARNLLSKKIAVYIKNPAVNLNVIYFANSHANILGNVKKTVNIPLTNVPTTLNDALSLAEGLEDNGNIHNLVLQRKHHLYKIDLTSQINYTNRIILLPHDLIYVNPYYDKRVYILGEVKENTTVWLKDEKANLAEILSNTQGMNISRAINTIYIIRKTNKKTIAYYLNINSPLGLLLAGQFKMQHNDIVYVGTKNISLWHDMITQLLPSELAGTIADIGGVIYDIDRMKK